jgi:thiamine transporter
LVFTARIFRAVILFSEDIMTNSLKTSRISKSAVLIALATVLAVVCAYIPFLNLPFGGGFTVASMLPIVMIAYMYGTKWGLFSAFVYSLVQLALGAFTGGGYVISLFTVGSDDFQGVGAGIAICLLDYIVAYTVLGLGGVFRRKLGKTPALVLGSALGLGLRYIVHIISGYIFFSAWAEWFFSQEGFYAIGGAILNTFSGSALGWVYSIFYNGLYMIPEIIITAVAAVAVSRIKGIRAE